MILDIQDYIKSFSIIIIIDGDGIVKEWFLKTNTNYIYSRTNYSEKKKKIIKYGMECIYTIITKTFVVLVISALVGTIEETCLLLIFYALVRMFGFGIHATKNLYCWIISLFTYIVLPLILKYIEFNQMVIIMAEFISLIGLILWAPADTKKRPLIHENQRKKDKIILLIIVGIYIIYSELFNNIYSHCMMMSMILEFICTCPLTYFIFKQPFNNYKYFKMV